MRPIHLVVIHCSDSPNGRDIGVHEIRDWHLDRGFTDIGYHYVIRRSGVLEEGRPIGKAGAHVQGHNKLSVGICLVGRDKFTKAQLTTLHSLVVALMEEFDLEKDCVVGHYELNPKKTCPNIDMDDYREHLP